MTNDVFTGSDYNLFERADGSTRWVSGPLWTADPMIPIVDAQFGAASKDGSRVFFTSNGRLSSEDNDTAVDVYERSGGVIRLISKPAAPGYQWDVEFDGISDDGRRVFLRTYDQLTGDDTDNGLEDVYERAGGVTKLVAGGNATPGANDAQIEFADVSRDGSRVFFHTHSRMTADDEDSGRQDVYERSGGVTTLVSKPTGVTDPDTGGARLEALSHDGSRVFFTSEQDLTPDDDDSAYTDVYERTNGVTTLISTASQEGLVTPAEPVYFGGIAGDGSHVYFQTTETMTADDTDTLRRDVFERSAGKTTLISKPSGVADPDDDAGAAFRGVNEDGSAVFFETDQRLVARDDDGGQQDVYRRAGGVTTLISRASGVPDPGVRTWFLGASGDPASPASASTAASRERAHSHQAPTG